MVDTKLALVYNFVAPLNYCDSSWYRNWCFQRNKNPIVLTCVRGDQEEVFFNYSCCENKSKVPHSVQKRQIPNVFSGMVLNKYKNKILNEKWETS